MRDNALFPIDFDFRIGTDDSVSANAVLLVGKHGGEGYYELDDDLLFISLGIHGGCPPRFASDCGDFFAFERDRTFDLPNVPPWPRDDLVSPHLGLLRWQDNDIEWLGAWIGQVMLTDGSECEIWASDYLIPLRRFLPTLEHVFLWLKQHLSEVKRICAERVMEWIDEDEEFCQLQRRKLRRQFQLIRLAHQMERRVFGHQRRFQLIIQYASGWISMRNKSRQLVPRSKGSGVAASMVVTLSRCVITFHVSRTLAY